MKLKIIYKAITICFLLIGNVLAQTINEDEFINLLQKTHPFFAIQKTSSAIKYFEKQATEANKDWNIVVNTNYQKDNLSDVISSSYDDLSIKSINSSMSKKIIDSGGDLTLKHSLTDKNNAINTTKNAFSIDYTHPLLKDANGINDTLNTDLATIEIKKNYISSLEEVEEFIKEKLKIFIDLAYMQNQHDINISRLKLNKKELKLVKEKFSSSIADKVDVLLQEDAYQSSKQLMLQSELELDVIKTRIKVMLDIKKNDISADFDLFKKYLTPNIDLKTYLTDNSRDLQIFDLNQNILDRKLKSIKNQLESQLNLNFGITTQGENNNYTNSIKNQSLSWNIGLNFNHPIGQTLQKANINKTSEDINKLKAQKQEQLLNILTKAKTLKQQLKSLEEILKSSKKQIQIAKDRAIEEKKDYDNGNSQMSFVISAQNNEQKTKLNYVNNARKYQKTIVDFKAVIDKLFYLNSKVKI